jgi:hypothetical protein
VASWIRCETCRKVLATDAYDEGQISCRSCLTGPAPKPRTTRVSAVKTVRPAAPAPASRGPLLGVAGSGDLEMRERRARRAALESLAEMHTTDFEHLLMAARQIEGLRA